MKIIDRIIDGLKLYEDEIEYDDEVVNEEKAQPKAAELKEKAPLFRKKTFPAQTAATSAPVEQAPKKSFFGGFGKKSEPEVPAAAADKMGSRTINLPIANKLINVVVVEPVSFDDSQKIADYLRSSQPVVVNFEHADNVITMRMTDFISGTIYAIGGSMKKLSRTILVCAPKNVDIDAENEEPIERGGQHWER